MSRKPVDYKFEDFEADLRDALGSLYDPSYEAPERLAAKLGCGARHRGSCVQNLVLEAIDQMEQLHRRFSDEQLRPLLEG